MLDSKKRIHLIGIGGMGMNAIAQLLLGLGHRVSGSDIKSSRLTRKITSLGAEVFIGHSPQNIGDVDLVAFSSAIRDDNPELLSAKEMGIPVFQRAEVLAELMKGHVGIAVAGTHGKTTTTSLIAVILSKAGISPTVAIGGEANDLGGGSLLGEGPYFVTEADESDGSFCLLSPTYSVVTNIEEEHLDFYHDIDEILQAFNHFLDRTDREGALVACIDDPNVRKILNSYKKRFVTYGFSPDADISGVNIEIGWLRSRFDCRYKGQILGPIELRAPEIHNILNALAAIGVAMELGIDFDCLTKSLAEYQGVTRRFEVKLETEDLIVIDDYAHHPTEVKATLNSCRNGKRRIVCVFQPHRYTRTKCLGERFGGSFSLADHLILTDIYSADETPIEGVSSKVIYDAVKRHGQTEVHLVSTNEEALDRILKIILPGDMVVCLGAGDVGVVADELARRFVKK